MEIRLLMAKEMRMAAETAVEVYTERMLQHAQTPEEIDRFQRYVNEDHLWVELCKNKLFLWGAFENGIMCAVSAMENTGRITMLYVKTAYMRGRCAAELEQAMRAYAVSNLGLSEQNVWIELTHPQYEQMGQHSQPQKYEPPQDYGPPQNYGQPQNYDQFQDYSQPQNYGQSQNYGQFQDYNQPQNYGQSQNYGQFQDYNQPQNYGQAQQYGQYAQNPENENSRKKAIQVTLIVMVVLFMMVVIVILAAIISVKKKTEMFIPEAEKEESVIGDDYVYEPDISIEDWLEFKADMNIGNWPEIEEEEQDLSVNGYEYLPDGLGVEMVVPQESIYIEEDLVYTVSEECIEVPENRENGFLEFEINYPQIAYADGRDASAVNQMLRETAGIWFDKMYPEPDKEKLVYDEDNPYLASYVDYQITYMSNELLCVAFNDEYFAGSVFMECSDMRTCVINLVTGEAYDVEDVLTHDEAFDALFYDKICEEIEDFLYASAFDEAKAGATVEGEVVEGRYFSNLLISKEGIRINLTYHYADDSCIMRGWGSMPFSEEELAGYHTDSTFWELYKN